MNENEPPQEKVIRIKGRHSPEVRFFLWFCGICAALVLIAGLALGTLYLRLQNGPLSFPGLPGRVVAALSGWFEPDWKIGLDDAALELEDGSFALRVRGLDIVDGAGRPVLHAPDTMISVDTMSLLLGRLNPRLIDFRDLQAVGTINTDGSVTFVPVGTQSAPDAAVAPAETVEEVPEPPAPTAGPTIAIPHGQSRLSQIAEGALDILVGAEGPIGILDRAQFTNLRLTLIDTQRRIRARFSRIDAKFERTPDRGRTFDARFEGSRGSWTLRGDAQPIPHGYQLVFNAQDAPVQDLLFLSGLSSLPVATTLKVSGRADVSMTSGLLNRLDASFGTGEGRVDVQDKDATPLFVNSSAVTVSWDEAKREMLIGQLEFRAGDTHVRFSGGATARPGEPWRVQLAADNAVLSGVTADDRPVPIDRLETEISGNGGITLERLSLKGPHLDANIKAQYGVGEDPKAIAVEANASHTAMRSLLRLWPEIVASSPRRYLISSLRGGIADRALIKVNLSGEQVSEAMHGGSIPDDALLVDMDVSDGGFLPTSGLPPLTKAKVTARVTGRTAAVNGADAVVVLPDGRSLNAPAVSFNIDDFWPKDAVASIHAEAHGGADALTSFLNLPKIQEAFSWDVDPKDIKGKADLKLQIGLAINNVPKFADLPIAVDGNLSDITLNGAIGEEKLEKATITANYDNGALVLKGEGQLAGYPATIDISQPPHGKGAGTVLFSLDDAARARKGLELGSQMTGVLPVKVTLALGKNERGNYRVEADMTKVAINNLIPGWVKPAGKAAKLSLAAKENEDGSLTISDLSLDSGNVRFTGKASLDADGALVGADLSSFQLSQGDDMQVKLDKAADVYKVVVRGNLADARPVIRAFTDTSGNGQRAAASARGGAAGADVDFDGSFNILTGFNNEALTKTSLKLGLRNGSIRQLQLSSKIGSAPVSAWTEQKGNVTHLHVNADNGGAILRFLDIYRRMYGGDILLDVALGDGAQSGYVMSRKFTIRDEPALKRIVPGQTQRDGSGGGRIDVSEVLFSKARASFTRTGSRIDSDDAAIWGTQIGFTLSGYLDFPKNKIDISGTFVPAYGLNNAFAQVPLFGLILGGGQNGGLFGVNFRLTGAAASPTVTVNPLSAIAPGIFRKLFGAGGPDAPDLRDIPPPPR